LSIAGTMSNAWTIPPSSKRGLGSTTPAAITPFSPDLFQQLAANAQALLLQGPSAVAQPASATGSSAGVAGSGTSAGSTTNAGGGTATAALERQLATDLQSFFGQSQSIQPGGHSDAQAGSTTQTTAAGQTQLRHHHHQSDGSSADTNTSGGTTVSSSTSTSQSSSSDQILSEAFAATIVQAIRAYGSQSLVTATTSLTV
jgi:hypothetical protein